MKEATMFSLWVGQNKDSTLTREEIYYLSKVDITTKLSATDLFTIMYHGKDDTPMLALEALKELFEWEMHVLEERNQHQGGEE